MLIAAITGPDLSSAERQIKLANELCDGAELRLDLIDKDVNVQELIKQIEGVSVLTSDNPTEELFGLEPNYLTLPWDHPFLPVKTKTKTIRAYHNFDKTPENLDEILSRMPAADIYKMVTFAGSILDAMRMLLFAKKRTDLIGLCMGEVGEITRILSPLVDNPLNFCAVEERAAPGQLFAQELNTVYHYRSLSSKTVPYGLIGDPIVQSPSHHTHNRFFRENGDDAVYVKMRVEKEDLPGFIPLAAEFGFKGLSVTIPHKEAVCQFVDAFQGVAKEIGAVNTLTFQDDQIYGANTDAKAALDVLEEEGSVKGKCVVIVGAGGAARAIAYEAVKRGALVTIANRTAHKAEELAKKLGCSWSTLDEIPKCDLVVNTTSVANLSDSVKTSCLSSVVIGSESLFGMRMFSDQALGQFGLWGLMPILPAARVYIY